MDAFCVAMSRYKRRKYDQAIELCDQMLQDNSRDQLSLSKGCMDTQMQFIGEEVVPR